MEDGKISKEQIEFYYKTSRKYFDELAKQYYETDRDFYNKNFASYYSPLKSLGAKPKKMFALVFAMMGLIAGVGVVSFFFLTESPDNKNTNYKKSVSDEKGAKSVDDKKIENSSADKLDSMNLSYMKTDFEKGTYYNFAQDVLKAIERKKASQNSAKKK
jgi:hypothetical protein